MRSPRVFKWEGRIRSSLSTDIQSVLVTTSARAITIPVTLYKMEDGKIAEATALIDSGEQSVALTSTWLKG